MAKDDSNSSSYNNNNVGSSSSSSQQQQQQNQQGKQIKQQRRSRHHKSKYPPRNDINLQIETQLKQQSVVKRPNGGNSRKNQISINHLLDFQSYKDSEEYQSNKSKRRGSGTRNNYNNKFYQPPKIQLTGMKFINVNYKFVIDNRKQYRIQQLDPNIPVDIEDIIRIIVPKGNACPICLADDPIAPRMITSCGHIICLKCVLSLLESEVPKAKKTESSAIIEKYRDCPLCSCVIRKKELKPVLINTHIDERFETPKVNNDVILTLMNRQQNKILAIPRALSQEFSTDDFPDIMSHELMQYSRIFKGDSQYLLNMYQQEKLDIQKAYEEEKLMYGDDNPILLKKAIDHIDDEIDHWMAKLSAPIPSTPSHSQEEDSKIHHHSGTFYFYQTGFNANCIYVLAPLDMKLLKTTYASYENLPSTIIAKIENIRYEELNSETCSSKYKYLSHLPLGTQIGFLECNWNKNEYINQESWETYKVDLIKRTQKSLKKFKKEERDKKRAMDQEEIKTRNFYNRENGLEDHMDDYTGYVTGGVGGLSIIDNRDLLPSLERGESSAGDGTGGSAITDSEIEYQTTVWGTKIPKGDAPQTPEEDIDDEDDWDAEEMIRKAKEEMNRQQQQGKKKKKKKLILLSS
ncbi:uncharacterized protein J8A68_001187 [[Candida] subhashii]|uniref:RING-type domain-containing protein n=1 Tax=[Candida] subhashii TaxID=561895 RepID=A0A8J5UR20_9ASCO|nr:uncharacterized protein J8A68_001187 [[Candida] subhashii]KAG7665131.1 hypothetical protein J8A68_001187 [[Candida] subhashii]